MRILGIDPGSQITGYGIIEKQGQKLIHIDNGGIFTESKDLFVHKLGTIFNGILKLIEKYSPDAVSIEDIFYAKNIKSTIKLGQVRGAIIAAIVSQKIEVYEYTPLAVKQAITGYGRASKEQIQKMIKQLLKLPETTYYDSSDALAIAICHLNTSIQRSAISSQLKKDRLKADN